MNEEKPAQNFASQNNMAGRKILLVTRPIAPPWDEASKNFAYYLAINPHTTNLSDSSVERRAKNFGVGVNSPDFEFYLLTNGIIPNLPPHIHQEPIYTSNSFNFFQKIKLLKYLWKKKDDFNILHFLFTPTKLNSALVRTLIRTNLRYKKIKTIQTIATLREDLFQDSDFKKILFADRIVTYSKYAKNRLNKMGFNNVEQIYPGIDLDLYSPAQKDNQLLTTYNLRQDDFIVTYPGEFVRLGATDDIVEMIISTCHSERSVSEVEESNKNTIRSLDYAWDDKIKKFIFVFACRIKNKEDQKKKEEIKRKLEEKGLSNLVRFPETFTTMEKMLNTSDVVIFPIREMKGKFDVPLVVIEAMACGKPVIISDLPILQEFANEQNSVIIKSGDMKQLMDSILELYQNKEKRETIGQNARKFVEENFDIKKISDKYKEVYKNILSS